MKTRTSDGDDDDKEPDRFSVAATLIIITNSLRVLIGDLGTLGWDENYWCIISCCAEFIVKMTYRRFRNTHLYPW